MSVRVVVCAYSEVGHACLAELLALGADVRLVLTHRDAPGETVWFPSVAELARAHGVPVITDDANDAPCERAIRDVRPDFLLSFYYRRMIRPDVLALARRGALNLHGSLLPRYRGRSPVNWVLLHGEKETGVSLHYMDAKPDHGDLVAQRAVAIDRDDTALSLTRKLAAAARAVLRETWPRLAAGTAERRPQDHARSSYFGGRRPEDGELRWTEPVESIRNLVRAVTDPWPGAFTGFRGSRLYVWWAETRPGASGAAPGELRLDEHGRPLAAGADGWVELVRVGREGEPARDGAAWARAVGLGGGEHFETTDRDPSEGGR